MATTHDNPNASVQTAPSVLGAVLEALATATPTEAHRIALGDVLKEAAERCLAPDPPADLIEDVRQAYAALATVAIDTDQRRVLEFLGEFFTNPSFRAASTPDDLTMLQSYAGGHQ